MDKSARIFVAGASKLIGAAVLMELKRQGYSNVLGDMDANIDLMNQEVVKGFLENERPEYVVCAAGRSGGIAAHQKFPADFIFENLQIECNVINLSYQCGVKKLLYLASSCSYPKHSPQPMKEEHLLTGLLEPTCEAYAIAKIAGIKMCQAYRQQYGINFICGIAADNFGPNDDFSFENSHVIGALIHKMHDAKQEGKDKVVIWGTGQPIRDFIYVEDLARACIFVLEKYDESTPINLGVENGISIGQLAKKIKKVCGFTGEIVFDTTRPDGIPKKVLDAGKLRDLGWKAEWDFEEALSKTYLWFIEHT